MKDEINTSYQPGADVQPARSLAERILSKKAGRPVRAGEFLLLTVDVALGNDITAPVAIDEFYRHGGDRVFDPDRIVLVPDHFTPNKDIQSAQQVQKMRDFAVKQGIKNYFEIGRMGIEHVLLPEKGLVKSGDLALGADSHTCTYGALGAFATGAGSTDLAGIFLTGKAWFRVPHTIYINITGSFRKYVSGKDLILKVISILGTDGANYQSLEFRGNGIANISMDSRFTIANMAIEAGAKAGLFPVDQVTAAYEAERDINIEIENANDLMDINVERKNVRVLEICLDDLKPQVAFPFLPSNCRDIDIAQSARVEIRQVVIGSCTNGRLEDLRRAAAILNGKKIHPSVRCLIIPGSQSVYRQAMAEGLLDTFVASECAVSTPTCGPCLGGHMGILARGERALATTNRNFRGRMGHIESEVYLASPEIAAASAIKGFIAAPDDWTD